MTEIIGLTGYRPNSEKIDTITCPPYDVIKSGTPLESLLEERQESVFHVTLGSDPKAALDRLIENGDLQFDDDPAFYVYEQNWDGGSRLGVFAAVKVDDYSEKNVIRHEKTFDDKVRGRIELAEKIGLTTGPIFLLTQSPVQQLLERAIEELEPLYSFASDFGNGSDLHGIRSRIFKVVEDSATGRAIQSCIAENPLYIADGHHRYHAALKNNQTHTLSYIVGDAKILAYNRVISGPKKFDEIEGLLELSAAAEFKTPAKHEFCLYTKKGTFTLKAKDVPEDVVGKLDCSILEKELYPLLGIRHEMIMDQEVFDYYSELDLRTMKSLVDAGKYDLAVALNPVSVDELIAVADAGLENPEMVMPEKSTFFSPKILTGIFFYQHSKKKRLEGGQADPGKR